MKKIAIIILGYNSQQHYDDCLSSLLRLDYSQDDYDVIVFDNASTDDSVAYIKQNYPQVIVYENKDNLGFAAGYNKAVEILADKNYDYYCLINDDTVSTPDFLNKLVAVIEQDDKIAAVQARLMLYPDKTKINSLGNHIHYLGFGYSDSCYQEYQGVSEFKEITYASGAAMLVRKEIIDKIGLFENDFFMYHDDLDLGWRIRLAGYKILINYDAVVYHKYKFAKSLKQYYWMERNRFICIMKNYKWKTIVLITPACLVMELGLFLFAIKSGFWLEKLKVYTYFLKPSSWKKIFERRKIIQSQRQVKDMEVVKFFVGKIENQELDNWLLRKIVNPVFDLYWQMIRKIIIW